MGRRLTRVAASLAAVGVAMAAAIAAWPLAWSIAGATLAPDTAGRIPATLVFLGAPFLLAGVVLGLTRPYVVTVRPLPDAPELEPAG